MKRPRASVGRVGNSMTALAPQPREHRFVQLKPLGDIERLINQLGCTSIAGERIELRQPAEQERHVLVGLVVLDCLVRVVA